MNDAIFSSLELQPELLTNLESIGYTEMTPIQAQSLPPIIAGKDVIGQGKTGSGKTAAFGLGLLNKLDVKLFRIQALVLCPTRELADQVTREIRRLARAIHNIKVLTLCGGMPFGPQIGSLEHGAHIIVGTPGRIEEHLRKGKLALDHVHTLVLDEADRMLEMGFQVAVEDIISHTPARRQTLLFSATFPSEIENIAARVMRSPVIVRVESHHDSSSIDQSFYKVGNDDDRLRALRLLLLHHQPESSVIFCNTKRETQALADELKRSGFNALAIHGDLEQRDRDQALTLFSNKSASVLVATDVAARGLDIDAVDAVFNYHLARDTEVHVHRIGRTGRAGASGMAFSFYADSEHYKIKMLEDYLEIMISAERLPSESVLNKTAPQAAMSTLQIDGGKKQKVRAGDILGALTAAGEISGKAIGKINIMDNCAYVAVARPDFKMAMAILGRGKIKGRSFRVRKIGL